MGEVWAAKHVTLQEEVAVKLVLRDVAHGDGSSADSRFLLEARVASQLSRKTRHIVSVTDHGEHGPYAYLVMELLAGESLDARLARTGPMPLEKVVPLVYQVARALAVAHADGIVHRDLKPSNVFVTVDEEGRALVKILDFGIAKLRASMQRIPAAEPVDDASAIAARPSLVEREAPSHATLTGFLLGTPAYMSPEQASGRSIDHRADVWALAVIAYHLLTGEYPFDGPTPEELLLRLCRVRPIPITEHRTDLPPAILDLFGRAFAKHLNARFQSAVAFAGALEHVLIAQKTAQGSAPRPMKAISVPPASDLARAVREPKATESSIVAAGVPRKRKLWPKLVAAAAVLVVLLTTASMLTVYFERDTKTTSLAPRAPVTSIGGPRAIAERDEIPPPEPSEISAAPAIEASELPAAPEEPVLRTALLAPRPQVVPTTTSLPVNPPPAATSPVAASPQQAPAKNIDRSEVF